MSDEDPLLAVPFDIDRRANVHRRLLFAELLDLCRETVGQLLLELLEGGLSDELARKEAERLGADVVRGVEEGALGEHRGDGVEHRVYAFACGGGDEERGGVARRRDRAGRDGRRGLRGEAFAAAGREEIGFV